MTEEYVGYENLIRFLEERNVQSLEGDIVEIGAYMGGGTVKLAAFAKKYDKRVFAIDAFNPAGDKTMSPKGVTAGEVYEAFLHGESMTDVYERTTRGFDNIVTVKQDSRDVRFSPEQRFVFGFVDGCHQEEYVENDFRTIWPHLVSGGVLGFHDYKFDDWPEVTVAADRLVTEHCDEIRESVEIEAGYGVLTLMLIKK